MQEVNQFENSSNKNERQSEDEEINQLENSNQNNSNHIQDRNQDGSNENSGIYARKQNDSSKLYQQSPQPNGKTTMYSDNSDFKTPFTRQIDSGPTLETEFGESPLINKKSAQRKGIHQSNNKSSSKNFIQKNKNVQTRLEMFSKFSEKKKIRISEVSQNRIQKMSLYERKTKLTKVESNNRLQDWKNLNLRNDLLSKEGTSQQGTKNVSKEFVVKHLEVSLQDLKNKGVPTNNRGGTFAKSRKERGYHITNSSSITNLNSYKSMDIPDRKEVREFPTTKGNQQLKRAMNQSQVFERTNAFLKDEQMPEEFNSHRSVERPVHNVNNLQVHSYRLRNTSSNVF